MKLLSRDFRLKRFSNVWQIICYLQNASTRTPLGGAHYQAVLVFRKGEPKLNMRISDIIHGGDLFNPVKDPQFKCTAAIGSLLQTFSKPGDLVLDPFAGYGSVPLMCELLGRRWIAFEIDPLKALEAVRFISSNLRSCRLPDFSNFSNDEGVLHLLWKDL